MLSLILACLHHLTLLGLIIMVGRQAVLLEQTPLPILPLSKLDKGVGMGSGLILVIGLSRVIWGEKGWAFYQSNPFFWAKMVTFLLIGLLSIGPTVMFVRWHKQSAANTTFTPPLNELQKSKNFIRVELALVGFLFVFAAAMARWPF